MVEHNIVVRNTESVIVKQYPVPFHTEKTKRKLENVPRPALPSVCFWPTPEVEKIESLRVHQFTSKNTFLVLAGFYRKFITNILT